MTTKIFTLLAVLFIATSLSAQTPPSKTISQINITTTRILPAIVKERFPLKVGDIFDEEKFETAKQSLHDMRIFKSIDFEVIQNSNDTLTINIDAKDNYFVFPIAMASGGSDNMVSVMIIETNLFKLGEFSMLAGLANSNGYLFMGAFGMRRNMFNAAFGQMDYDEKVFDDGYFSASGFGGQDNKNEEEINKYRVKENSNRFGVSKSFANDLSVSLAFRLSKVDYSGELTPDDKGYHNTISLSLGKSKNMQSQSSPLGAIGMLFGLGTSDLKDRFARLKKEKFGYSLSANYENGGELIGSDFYISKLYLKAGSSVEFKNRDRLVLNLSFAYAFSYPFFDQIKSREMLDRGQYLKELRGFEALGATLSFIKPIFKTRTGFAIISPFVENVLVYDYARHTNITGAGLGFSYTFLKFPFPFGMRYTRNLSDDSYAISAIFGGSF